MSDTFKNPAKTNTPSMSTLKETVAGGFKRRFAKRSATAFLLVGTLVLLVLSVVLAVVSLYPATGADVQSRSVIDDSFTLTPNETYRQGVGSFHGDENLTLLISTQGSPVNFTLITYGGPRYANITTKGINYSFPAGADYYEVVFLTNATTHSTVHFEVHAQRLSVIYPFGWIGLPAKLLFVGSWGALILLLILPKSATKEPAPATKPAWPPLDAKNRRRLKLVVLASLVFWLVLLAINSFPLATFENWYTDSARNTYSANLFPKVGFAVFETPLGRLSSADASLYKFVTWPEMPHLYPLGSIFLYMPFGWLIEQGVEQSLVFKLEIAVFLLAAHICLYLFLKRFWKQDLDFGLKALAVYLLYIVLVVYSANGMFDSMAFLFSMLAFVMFLEKRYDRFLLFVSVSVVFKYQAGIFLFPLVVVGFQKLLGQANQLSFLKNKAVLAALGLAVVSLFTAFLSLPSLVTARPEYVMNGVNAFSPHAQISWWLQAFAMLLTLTITLVLALYLRNRNRLVSLFMVFSLLPCFTMPYFQPWYLPFFFIYPLLPSDKHTLRVTVGWLVFMVFVLSYGGFAYNPIQLLDNIRRVIGL